MVTRTYHLYPPAAISIYQARHYCTYANGLLCLFRLGHHRLLDKLLQSCLSSWETNYKNAFSKFCASSDSIITCNPLSLWASTDWKTMYIKFHWRKTMKQKVLAKQTDSCKIKFNKNVILKYICTSIFCLLFCSWST